jgi:hypothetical protein
VVDIEGVPVSRASVEVWRLGQRQAAVTSDALGRFSVLGLRGGVYQVVVGQQERFVRAWAAGTAPPSAREGVLMIAGHHVVRGQLTGPALFGWPSRVVATGLFVAAVVAVVDHDPEIDEPASP